MSHANAGDDPTKDRTRTGMGVTRLPDSTQITCTVAPESVTSTPVAVPAANETGSQPGENCQCWIQVPEEVEVALSVTVTRSGSKETAR